MLTGKTCSCDSALACARDVSRGPGRVVALCAVSQVFRSSTGRGRLKNVENGDDDSSKVWRCGCLQTYARSCLCVNAIKGCRKVKLQYKAPRIKSRCTGLRCCVHHYSLIRLQARGSLKKATVLLQ